MIALEKAPSVAPILAHFLDTTFRGKASTTPFNGDRSVNPEIRYTNLIVCKEHKGRVSVYWAASVATPGAQGSGTGPLFPTINTFSLSLHDLPSALFGKPFGGFTAAIRFTLLLCYCREPHFEI